MKTRLMGLAVFATAIAFTINALAYRTAAVTNSVTMSIVNTSAAALAFDVPTSVDPGLTVSKNAGTTEMLSVTINEAIQRNATYTWDQAFKITNNGGYTITLTCDTSNFPAGATVSILRASDDADMCTGTFAIATTVAVDTKLRVQTNSAIALSGATSYNLIITGTR